MSFCVLDAWHGDDPALLNSHWVAEQTLAALQREFPGEPVVVAAGDGLHGARVSLELAAPHRGFAFFGHGSQETLLHRGAVLVGRDQAHQIGDRWFHAFACWSGVTLCRTAADAGAAAYLGYRVAVNLHWDIEPLPGPLREHLAELVAAATVQLARGERSRDVVRRRVRAASDRLLEWLDTHADACAAIEWGELAGIHVLATLLHRDLELEGSRVTP